MSGTVDSPPTARLGRAADPEPGRVEGATGCRIAVSHTGELLELHLTDEAMSAGHEGVTSEVLGLYDQALAKAQANAVPEPAPHGGLPRRRR
ncbi:hypothetical protein FB566_1661 [Stackebrandtia endophytica]|uniref:YbaB/EbfC DNA-binding family protein n=1 Tax=Stackebrandtia endophytica TaxID=1496996 RepID=A0A543AUA5_9ACTN|nr:hypothetical protein [Stackebrandtia endophytica]TQL76140.1 hypothetical protein FB566_1661 [Stackebrandtia endophytica]